MRAIVTVLSLVFTAHSSFAQGTSGRLSPQVLQTQESLQQPGKATSVVPGVGAAGVPPGAPAPTKQSTPVPKPRVAPDGAPVNQQKMEDVSRNMQNGSLPPFQRGGDDVPANWDWSKGYYDYSDTHRFNYGGVGAGNIGSGLCTNENANRTQVKAGYCDMLKEILEKDGTCAKQMLDKIIEMDSRGAVQDLDKFCSNFKTLKTVDKRMAFQQVLASLIVQESGWRADAREPEWYKNGNPMGGKGLFQIDERDARKPDCREVAANVFDAKINMKCGACIALSNVVRDGAMGHGSGDQGSRGMARYFGPMRELQAHKRAAMQGAVNRWCVSSASGSNTAPAAIR